MQELLEVNNLTITFDGTEKPVVSDLSISVKKGRTLAIVGESGSGKSITSLTILGLLPKSGNISNGSLYFEGRDISTFSKSDFLKFRGSDVAMIFQEPMTALNPSIRCGEQCMESLRIHKGLNDKQAKEEVLSLFEKVKIPDPKRAFSSYPHQLSGGQRQRVMIAMAISCKPKLLIADEPTTALDVTVQKEILLLLKELQEETGMAMIFISHDLDVVKHLADEIIVMFKGEVMESGNAKHIMNNPQSDYTKGLLACKPTMEDRPKRLHTVEDFLSNRSVNPSTVAQRESANSKEIILEIKNLQKWFKGSSSIFKKTSTTRAIDDVSLKIYQGEVLGLVGESGCGKSTLGKCIVGLEQPEKGSILYNGKDILTLNKSEKRAIRKDIQIIFQDPFSSLNPRQKVGDAILEPMMVYKLGENRSSRKKKVQDLLEKVGLQSSDYDKYPHEFSGGQRQRIGIARALVLEPKLIICDESVSALDVSVQAQVLNLLNDLKDEFGFTYIFISHDLSVVYYMSDHLAVMNSGKIEEYGQANNVFKSPQQDYTKKLIDSVFQ